MTAWDHRYAALIVPGAPAEILRGFVLCFVGGGLGSLAYGMVRHRSMDGSKVMRAARH